MEWLGLKLRSFEVLLHNFQLNSNIVHWIYLSLINLKRDYIDIYYFHHGDFGENDKYLDDAIEVMYRLRDEGKIRLIGQSAYKHEDFVKLIPKVKPDVIQSFASAIDYRFLKEGSPTRKLLDEHQISFIAFGPLAQGILLGKYSSSNPPQFEPGDHRANADRFKPENLAKVEPKIELLKQKFGSSVQELARAALQFLLHFNQVGAVIPGFRNLQQVKNNLFAADKPLTDDEFEFIVNVFND